MLLSEGRSNVFTPVETFNVSNTFNDKSFMAENATATCAHNSNGVSRLQRED
jgi:hypothetical protein